MQFTYFATQENYMHFLHCVHKAYGSCAKHSYCRAVNQHWDARVLYAGNSMQDIHINVESIAYLL